MKVLITGTDFDPSYGGPARSVSKMAKALAYEGLQVGIWAPSNSAMVTPFLDEKSGLLRLGGSIESAIRNFGKPDIIHDNGIWMPHNHRIAQFANREKVPRVVSIRGMLRPWSMRHKRYKKLLAWKIYQHRDLARASLIHVTSWAERRELLSHALNVPVCMVPNGICKDLSCENSEIISEGKRVAIFLGRIYPVKGLPMLVEAWAAVRPKGWIMKIIGPDEANHQADIEKLVYRYGLEEVFEFVGAIDGKEKSEALSEADLFILPTHSENFGMAIGEALAHSTPVITTRGAPWELLEQERCGWWTEVSSEGLAAALRDATAKDSEELRSMGIRGREMVRQRFSWSMITRQIQDGYLWLLGGSRKPACISKDVRRNNQT